MSKHKCQCEHYLQIAESLDNPLNQLLMQIESSDDIQEILNKDWKLIQYDIIINSLTEKMDEIDQWTFKNDQFIFDDALFGKVILTEKSKNILYHFYDVLSEIKEQIVQLKKEHMMNNLDEFPEYHDLIYDDEF